jgi:hypothetical protein
MYIIFFRLQMVLSVCLCSIRRFLVEEVICVPVFIVGRTFMFKLSGMVCLLYVFVLTYAVITSCRLRHVFSLIKVF